MHSLFAFLTVDTKVGRETRIIFEKLLTLAKKCGNRINTKRREVNKTYE